MATKPGTKPPATDAAKTTPPGSKPTKSGPASAKESPSKAAVKTAAKSRRKPKRKSYRDQISERIQTVTEEEKKARKARKARKRALRTQAPKRALTDKQMAFCVWYTSALVNMNATEAARRAGYKGSDTTLSSTGAENMTKPAIRAEIDRRLAKAMSGADITVENVLRRLSVIGEKALDDRKYAPAAKCAELHGKYLKMFTDRIEHVQDVEDMTTAELVRLLTEVCEAGGIDLLDLITGNEPDHRGLPDPPGSATTH